ncbi:MAG: hypothetical protein AB2A00_15585 [Myxococcota bacterium]
MNHHRPTILAFLLALQACAGSTEGTTTSSSTSSSSGGQGSTSSSSSGGASSSSSGASSGNGATSSSGNSSSSTGGSSGAGMTFFVTSVGNGANGGNYGGLNGADQRCQSLAEAAGSVGRTWRAYLSTSTVDARDRIGTGPWLNVAGEQVAADVASLHANGIPTSMILDENGAAVPREEHDILTGSTPEGTVTDPPYTCGDWTSNAEDFYAWVGHADWSSEENPSDNWSSTHETPCDQAGMAGTLSAGRIYCFAE